jgi:hypothetical protein
MLKPNTSFCDNLTLPFWNTHAFIHRFFSDLFCQNSLNHIPIISSDYMHNKRHLIILNRSVNKNLKSHDALPQTCICYLIPSYLWAHWPSTFWWWACAYMHMHTHILYVCVCVCVYIYIYICVCVCVCVCVIFHLFPGMCSHIRKNKKWQENDGVTDDI